MRKIRIVAEFNVLDDADEPDVRESMRILMEDVDEALINSDELESKVWDNPIIEAVYVEEEVLSRTIERWEL